ncbi:MAG: 4Fe-4S dicluster domain-containing protein [Coriobacteriales bacterium]|nr:4Fe-4S dicluster domain-containing protein [Coriobacteriales bacterium]
MSRKCLVVDLDKCIGCHACEVACKTEHDIALGVKWNFVPQVGPMGTFPNLSQYWLPLQCQQCENAPCIEVCPTGASYRSEDGVVLIDQETCIGCQLCMDACPYKVRSYDDTLNVVQKCTLCKELTDQGEKPACVAVCCGNARFFGDLDDPESDVSQALAAAGEENIHSLTDVGNTPVTRYILSKKIADWQEFSTLAPMSDSVNSPWMPMV